MVKARSISPFSNSFSNSGEGRACWKMLILDPWVFPAEHWQDVGEPQRVGGVVSADGEVAPLCLWITPADPSRRGQRI